MSKIAVLDQSTINKIAAGEVIERPAAVVKELVENAIDAGASAVTVEIKEGGVSFIRITDNGSGIAKDDILTAFLRHSTSKIKTVEDLLSVSSLGFRGEALSSIAAVSQVELITKTRDELTGVRCIMEGGVKTEFEEIGCPEGTTFLVRNLFYNTPARRKFLKTAMTEASYVGDLVERLAVSHSGISFKFIVNGQTKLYTSGNSSLKDIIYQIYGRDIAANVAEISASRSRILISGYTGKPAISRGNRNYMNYFINGRYIKSAIISKAVEETYKPYTMVHRYPFTILNLTIPGEYIDVNVHPTKMEVRFENNEEIFSIVYHAIKDALSIRELIPNVTLTKKKEEIKKSPNMPEPFETQRRKAVISPEDSIFENIAPKAAMVNQTLPANQTIEEVLEQDKNPETIYESGKKTYFIEEGKQDEQLMKTSLPYSASVPVQDAAAKQINLFEDKLLTNEAKTKHKIIGQIFLTYWIVEYNDKIFLIDQHAAHEKVLYEKTLRTLKEREVFSQVINPPLILTLNLKEEETLKRYKEEIQTLGFEIESFGGREYSLRSVPADFLGIADNDLFLEFLDSMTEEVHGENPDLILEKIASLSCKAAVKGNYKLTAEEAQALIDDLLELENPYHCPHGRPTIISMSKYEIEKKFKRII